MVLEHKLLERIPLHIQGLNYGKGVYELEDHVGEEALSSNLLKLGPVKKNPSFHDHLLKNAWIGLAFLYALLPLHEGVK